MPKYLYIRLLDNSLKAISLNFGVGCLLVLFHVYADLLGLISIPVTSENSYNSFKALHESLALSEMIVMSLTMAAVVILYPSLLYPLH